MEKFERALQFILREEGGLKLVQNPTEPLPTFGGIYRAAHPEWPGWKALDQGDFETAEKLLREFYFKLWNELKCDAFDYVISLPLFDSAILCGKRRAAKWLQKVVRVKADGVIGPVTISHTKRFNPKMVAMNLLKERLVYISKRPVKPYNLYKRGWINRVFDVMIEIELISM